MSLLLSSTITGAEGVKGITGATGATGTPGTYVETQNTLLGRGATSTSCSGISDKVSTLMEKLNDPTR